MKNSTYTKKTFFLTLLLTLGYNLSLFAQCYNTLGSSGNNLSTLESNTTQIVVNNDLNTVIFIHRNDNTLFGGDNGIYKYDISTDNGATWQLNQGSLNPNSTFGLNAGRYPQVAIHNPVGNTSVSNATLVYHGPTNAGGPWNGYVSGSQLLNGVAAPTENYNQAASTNTFIPGGMCKGAPGVFWMIDYMLGDGINPTGFRILKGTYGAGDVTWAVNATLTPDFNVDNFGPVIGDWNIAFDPTGQYGWAVVLTHLNGPTNYVYYPVFYKTTDGGNTWSAPIQLDLNSFSSITSVISNPTGGTEVDIAVDANGNPHALMGVFKAGQYPYSINGAYLGNLFDFTFNGSSWSAKNISRIAYTANFSTGLGVFNRPQISSSDDGNKMVFTWVESDIPTSSGSMPNLKAVTYDVPTGNVSCPINYANACPSMLDGQMYQTTVSPNMIEAAGTYTVPVVLSIVNASGSVNDPPQYYYLNDLQFTAANFSATNTPTYPTITASGPTTFCYGGSVDLTASVSSSYLWSTGETTQTITALGGTYWVINPANNTCVGTSNSASVESIFAPDIYSFSIPVLCPSGNSVDLYAAYSSSGNSILWSNGATTQIISVSTPGTYTVTVDGCSSLYGIDVTTGSVPANDNLCDAQQLTVGVATSFDNSCATVEPGEVIPPLGSWIPNNQDGWFADDDAFSNPALQNSVWFSFIAPSSGAVNIHVSGQDYQLALYSSSDYTCNGTLTLIAANEDGEFFLQNLINQAYCLKKGKRYFVQVDGYFGTQGPGTIEVVEVPNTVTICHRTSSGTSQNITVSGCALQAHLAHGDVIGECPAARFSTADAEEVSSLFLNVFPNPAKDVLNISFTSEIDEEYTLNIIDITGRTISSATRNAVEGENETQLDLSDLKEGVYIVQIRKGDKLIQANIVKQ